MLTPLRLLSIALCAAFGLVSSAANAQQPAANAPRKLVVTSSATIYAAPDSAVLTFAVHSKGTGSKEARASLTKRVNTIKDEIGKLELKGIAMTVVPFPLSPLVAGDPNPDGTQPTVGFEGRTQFTINIYLDDVDQLREMVTRVGDVAVEHGAVGLGEDNSPRFRVPPRLGGFGGGPLAASPPEKMPPPSVEWRRSNNAAARQDAVKKAVESALASARTIADPAPPKIMEVVVQSSGSLDYSALRLSSSDTKAAHAGKVAISVTVQLTCSY